jgi:hypothetical protein
MAFDLTAVRDGVSYSLTAGTPFKLAHAAGLFWPEVNRVTLRAPTQDGDVDYGAYLSPRLITLSVHFYATSGSALDGYRDTFYRIFRPSRSTGSFDNLGDSRFAAQSPITLQVTRDDAVVRKIGVYATGPIDIALEREHGPGNLHRAVVQLVAPNPTWFGTAAQAGSIGWFGLTTIVQGNIVYDGQYYTHPLLTLKGSAISPVFNNVTTGESITFGTVSLTQFQTMTVNTETLTATVGAVAVYPTAVTGPWRLAPAPEATGGTNSITVVSGYIDVIGTTTPPHLLYSYTPRYVSY